MWSELQARSNAKLLLDQNLSPRLLRLLADIYPASAHVRDLGLAAADDETVWRYAGTEGFTIVTKDDDFRQRSFPSGSAAEGGLGPPWELPNQRRRGDAPSPGSREVRCGSRGGSPDPNR